ncbi:MAG TPA: hypothetical protein VEC93_01220 [Anaerolineae bacterium]|nr:hypothetical protein [Anaerolineae bacterium]
MEQGLNLREVNWPALWRKIDTTFFPDLPRPTRSMPVWQYLLFVIVGVAVFSFVGSFLPPTGLIGFDWLNFFSTPEQEAGLSYYPPWIKYVSYLSWPVLLGLTFTGLALALYQRRASLLVIILAFLTLPTLWVVFLGQVEGIVLFGLTGLPWLVPLITIKPQVGYLAFLARKRDLAVLLIWLALSIVIWGPWPLNMLTISNFTAWEQPHDISLWPWSLPLFVILLWFSRGDEDMLMLAGMFALPYLHSYHYFVVLPAMARVTQWVAVAVAVISWLPLLANWLGPWAWQLGHLFPIILWLNLYFQRRTWLRANRNQPLTSGSIIG